MTRRFFYYTPPLGELSLYHVAWFEILRDQSESVAIKEVTQGPFLLLLYLLNILANDNSPNGLF